MWFPGRDFNNVILEYLGYEMPIEKSWLFSRQDQDVFFCLLQIVPSGTGAHPAPRSVGIRSSFPGVRAGRQGDHNFFFLTVSWPCIVINSYNKANYMHYFLKFIFGIKLYMFRTVPLSSKKILMMGRVTVRNM